MTFDVTGPDLLGSWELVSWLIHYPDGRPPGKPFGDRPSGLLQYLSDGSMSATVHRSGRTAFPEGVSPRRLDGRIIAEAYLSYFHYAGTFRIEGDRVIHTVRHSLNQAMVGTEQIRQVILDPPELRLVGIEPLGDQARRHELHWVRKTS